MSGDHSSKQVSSQCLRDVKGDPESAAVVIMQQSAEIERLRAEVERLHRANAMAAQGRREFRQAMREARDRQSAETAQANSQ